ncbi:MAG: hypothetical protein AAF211_20390, partial [Myxococcota bacterium]
NVFQQVQNLTRNEVIQETWASEKRPMLHGWVFDHATDLIKPLVKVDAEMEIDDIFRLRQPEED